MNNPIPPQHAKAIDAEKMLKDSKNQNWAMGLVI
jgi:hypothetical protein